MGRSLENVVSISAQLGYLDIPDNLLISGELINRSPAEKLVIITTGSQGEPMSALTRMAFSDHRKVEICPNDYVIISANPIPGNEKTVGNVVNELMKLGAQVIYEKMYDVHVSGHACQEELKLIMGLVKPKFFIPVHGEQKHLHKHAMLAEAMGIGKENIFIADNGYTAEITNSSIKAGNPVPAGKEAEELIDKARKVAEKSLENCYYANINDIGTIKGKLRDAVSHFVYEQTKRSPMVLPIIMEV